MKRFLVPVVLLLAMGTSLPAAVPDRDWPSVVPTPAIDGGTTFTLDGRQSETMYYLVEMK